MEGLNKELRFTHNRGADLHYPNEVKWVQFICLLCFCLFTLYFSHAQEMGGLNIKLREREKQYCEALETEREVFNK